MYDATWDRMRLLAYWRDEMAHSLAPLTLGADLGALSDGHIGIRIGPDSDLSFSRNNVCFLFFLSHFPSPFPFRNSSTSFSSPPRGPFSWPRRKKKMKSYRIECDDPWLSKSPIKLRVCIWLDLT